MNDQDLLAVGLTILFVGFGLSAIPLDKWLERRRERADARKRNQARPWR